MTTAMELQEESFQEVRNKTIKFFLDWIGRSSSPVDVASFKDILGDRERSRHFILTIQFFINRALHFRSGASHLAQNELNELSLELAQNPQYDLSSWVVSSIQLDRDLQENVDNILSFENFLIDVSPNNICR